MSEMLKAFNTADRTIFLKDLSTNIDNDEFHLIRTMLGTELTIKCANEAINILGTYRKISPGENH